MLLLVLQTITGAIIENYFCRISLGFCQNLSKIIPQALPILSQKKLSPTRKESPSPSCCDQLGASAARGARNLWTILDSLRHSECLPSIVVRNASIQRNEENKSIAGSLIFFARYLQCVNIWVRFLKTCYGTNVRFNHKVHCTIQLTKGFCWEAQFQNITAPPEISCYSREKKLCCGLTAQMASFFGEVVTGSYRL